MHRTIRYELNGNALTYDLMPDETYESARRLLLYTNGDNATFFLTGEDWPMIEHLYSVELEGQEPWSIMAPDDEQAAWNALSLSQALNCTLIDVYRGTQKKLSKQLWWGVRYS